jgi:predicted transcriptional regulator
MPSKIQVYARIPEELVHDLDHNARLLGCTRSDLLQCAIARYVDKPHLMPYAARFSELERRVYDLELIVRSRPR